MCDEITEFENQGFYEKEVTRREFNLMAGGAAISLAFAAVSYTHLTLPTILLV